MMQRLGARILRTRVPVPVSLPTDSDNPHIPLTSHDQLTLDDLVHPRYGSGSGSDYRRKTHAPWRTLVGAVLLPGLLLLASTSALLWALPPLDDTLQWRDSYLNHSNVNVFERFEIQTKDHSARATFIRASSLPPPPPPAPPFLDAELPLPSQRSARHSSISGSRTARVAGATSFSAVRPSPLSLPFSQPS